MKSTETQLKKIFGKRIKQLRKEKKMTQEELSFAAGIDISYLGLIEKGNGNPTIEKIKSLADAFGCNISELFVFENDANYEKKLDQLSRNVKEHISARSKNGAKIVSDVIESIKENLLNK